MLFELKTIVTEAVRKNQLDQDRTVDRSTYWP